MLEKLTKSPPHLGETYNLDLHDWYGNGTHAIMNAQGQTLAEWKAGRSTCERNDDECAELVRRANAYAEAVELLRRVANPNQHGDPTPRELAGLRNDARAFLDKVKE